MALPSVNTCGGADSYRNLMWYSLLTPMWGLPLSEQKQRRSLWRGGERNRERGKLWSWFRINLIKNFILYAQSYIYLMYVTWWFNMLLIYEKLFIHSSKSTYPSSHIVIFCIWHKNQHIYIYTLDQFLVYNTILVTTILMPCIKFSEYLVGIVTLPYITRIFCPLMYTLPFVWPHPKPSVT